MAAAEKSVSKGDSPRSQRAAETRLKLLSASAELLAERGYSRLATAAIAKRAGVAHGTVFKHFATKTELMAATTEHVLEEMIVEFLRMAQQFAGQPEPIDHALNAVWSLFRSERLQATLELYVAARTDDSLRDALRPIFATHRSAFLSAARALLPDSADGAHFESNVTGILATLLGGALLWSVVPEPEFFQSELAFVDRITRAELARLGSQNGER
jgi:AcrR family transcriptional regulator